MLNFDVIMMIAQEDDCFARLQDSKNDRRAARSLRFHHSPTTARSASGIGEGYVCSSLSDEHVKACQGGPVGEVVLLNRGRSV